MKKKEVRNYEYEVRIESREDKPVIIGHGAVFNRMSENLGGFREQIDPKAFDEVLTNDVRALINHNSDKILGRTKSGTLRLSVDDTGLKYEIDPPDTSYAHDLLENLKRGDITQSSFGFSVEKDAWNEDADGGVVRTILKVARLYDVSPVTFPAYPDADVAMRGLEEFLNSKTEKQIEDQKKEKEAEEREECEKLRMKRLKQLKKLQLNK
jgi:uncharacterized protein